MVQRSKAGGSASVGATVVVVVDAVPGDDVEGATLIGGIDVARSPGLDVVAAVSPPQAASAMSARASDMHRIEYERVITHRRLPGGLE